MGHGGFDSAWVPPGRRRRLRLLAALALAVPVLLVTPVRAAPPDLAPPSPVDASPTDFEQVALAGGPDQLGEPMSMAVLPDLSVLHTARDGTLRRTRADGDNRVIGRLAVYTHDEDGLQGIGVDPAFATNRAIYLYYAPPLNTPAGDAPVTGSPADFAPWAGVNRLSRFTLNPDFTLNMASEKTVLEVAADRGMCCHAGGDIDFDAAGNLYLSTGDDTNPYESDAYSPIDEASNRFPAFDAQRSSANTNDLRGKVLRIKVASDGSYTIPTGNLFPPEIPKTRPEIYAMGLRNPFRMSVDRKTGVVYLGDYGPDADKTTPERGPAGQVEFNRIPSAGNYGWPYCTGGNSVAETYNRYDFKAKTSGAKYNCANPMNTSFRNTGLTATALPAARPAWIKYGGDEGSPPEFGTGSESPMGGPVYRYDDTIPSTVRFPRSFDGVYFAGEYGRQWIKTVAVNPDGSAGAIGSFPWAGKQVMDMAFGPDGALYVLDYGTGYGGANKNSGLYRIEYSPGGKKPIAKASADRTSGTGPLTVAFSSAGSVDPEQGPLSYHWEFGDGATSTVPNPSHTYRANGQYTAKLTVADTTPGAPKTATARLTVTVGNTAPTVSLTLPSDGQLFSFGETVPFRITVTDPEDATIDCAKARLTYLIGHDRHSHQITSVNGCAGQLTIPADGEHDPASNVYAVFDAEYTDTGANGQPALTTHTQHMLQPRTRQAEYHTALSRAGREYRPSARGGEVVGYITNGGWLSFAPFTLDNASSFTARVSSAGAGGRIEVRAGSPTGTLLGAVTVPVTGGWDNYTEVATTLVGAPGGATSMYLVFTGPAGYLFNLDEYRITTLDGGAPVEAEAFSAQSGVAAADHPPAAGGRTLGHIHHGDWAGYAAVSTAAARAFSARVSSAGPGGTIEVRSGSATGALLGSVAVPPTGGWETFTVVSTPLTPAGPGPLYLRFTGGAGLLFDVDSFALTTGGGGTGQVVGTGGECVGVAGGTTANGTAVVRFRCNGNPDQRWTVRADGTIRSSGRCLDVANYQTENDSPVHLWDCASPPTGNQVWVAQLDGTLKNPVSGRCLDADAAQWQLRLRDCRGGANQRWQLPVPVEPAARVLVFSRTTEFRHDSIAAGVEAVRQLGERHGFGVDATEHPDAFDPANLARYRAVVFLNTTGDVLDDARQRAFEEYINGGGGYLGVHAAADTEKAWPFYGRLVGAWFRAHPPGVQSATIRVEDRANPATAALAATWTRADEWYDFASNPRSRVRVLMSLDESTYAGGTMGADHPIAWCQRVGSGRSFYTGLGHTTESYADPLFRDHLLGGIRVAAGMAPADCAPPAP